MSECCIYDIIKLRDRICVKAVYMLLIKWKVLYDWVTLYDIIKTGDNICLNALYMILLK